MFLETRALHSVFKNELQVHFYYKKVQALSQSWVALMYYKVGQVLL